MTHQQRKFNIYNSIKRATKNLWVIPLSSDGYANYGTGDQLTSDGYGPHGLSNANAWCVLTKTINNQQYQFCIQTDGYMGLRLKYSKLGFNSGVDNLTVSPSAQDQQVLVGGGSDIIPTYQQIISGAFNFNVNGVFINLLTATKILNFTLNPKPAPVAGGISASPKPIVNKILT